MKSTLAFFGTVGLVATLSACDRNYTTTSYQDFLNASATVFASNGTSPVQNLAIQAYDWIVTFTDGSTVAVPFTPGVTTNASGKFNFQSLDLNLQSGNLAQRCTDVCVEWSTGYEDYCSYYETDYYDYCTYWDYDYYGNEYCAQWETYSDTYCVQWDYRSYQYCSRYGQDCSYYYPSRDVADIASAYSEISYTSGSSYVTTQSENDTFAAEAFSSTDVIEGTHTTVNMQWTQSNEFITLLSASSSPELTQKQLEIVAERNAGRRRNRSQARTRSGNAPRIGRTHAPAARVPFEQLTAEEKLKVEQARQAFGATPAADAGVSQ